MCFNVANYDLTFRHELSQKSLPTGQDNGAWSWIHTRAASPNFPENLRREKATSSMYWSGRTRTDIKAGNYLISSIIYIIISKIYRYFCLFFCISLSIYLIHSESFWYSLISYPIPRLQITTSPPKKRMRSECYFHFSPRWRVGELSTAQQITISLDLNEGHLNGDSLILNHLFGVTKWLTGGLVATIFPKCVEY